MKKSFTKLWKVMKICAAQVMIAVTICGVSAAHNNYAQLLERKVTLDLKDVSVEVVLKEMESVAGVNIFYSIDQLGLANELVSIQVADEPLRTVLDKLLVPYNIRYKVDEKKSTIFLKREIKTESDSGAEVQDHSIQPAGLTVTGTVTDESSQQPMAGVNVIVKGTTIGTTTDSNGKYSIQAEDNSILVFSFIGYATREVLVTNQTVIDIMMQEDVATLNEVVVNGGYYKTTKEYQTGNISRVTSKEIQQQPVSNVLAALEGRMPGVQITQLSGVPGANFTVRVRGTNSIANGNDPLYIIDGVPFTSNTLANLTTSQEIFSINGTSPLNGINPADIESIEVLKDADATSIYGSRGSNGVVLITTKKGQAGKTKVDVNVYQGAGKIATKVDLLNTQQYLEMRDEAFANAGVTPAASDYDVNGTWSRDRYTDWQDMLIGGTAKTTDAQVSISGGDNNTQFSVGTGLHRETTVFPGDFADQRISTRLSISNTSPNKKLKTTASLNYSIVNTALIKADLTKTALTLAPNAPALYDINGNLNWENSTWQNPLAYTKTNFESETSTLVGNAVVSYSIIGGLEAKVNMGFSNMQMEAIAMTPKSVTDPAYMQYVENLTTFSNGGFKNWIVEPQLTYAFKIGRGVASALIGTSFLSQESNSIGQYASGFASEALMRDIRAASTVTTSNNSYSEYRYHSVFGRLNYTYNERYIINVTARRDGSSRFGPDNRFSNFGAIGIAWIFSKQNFIENFLPFLSFGKLRANYGITGNDQLQNYAFLDTYTSTVAYNGVLGLTPVRLSNPDFSWESNKKLEATLDIGFLNDRITMSTSYYRNRSSNQLVGFPVAPTTGFTSVQGNFPATIENHGVEFDASGRVIQRPELTWSVSVNLTIPRNKLIDFPNLVSFQSYVSRFEVGEPTNISKTYRYLGVNPTTGLYQFEDVNNDGVFNQTDRVVIKEIGSNLFTGINSTLQFRGFQLDFLFQYVNQTANSYLSIYGSPGFFNNQPSLVTSRWKRESDETDIQKFSIASNASQAYSRLIASERNVVDASFLRLKNISLSYAIPRSWLTKLRMENLRVFLLGQNLFTVTNYDGSDPESPGTSLPPLKVLTGGINLTF